MKFIHIYIVSLIFAALIISCSDPEPLISPTHFNRVPRPVNITALSDTTVTGKFKITLNWSVNSEENLKDFSILRAFQIKKTNQVTFNATTLNYTKTTYADSAIINFSDTLWVYYYVQPRGKDSFIGQNSDTLKITLIK